MCATANYQCVLLKTVLLMLVASEVSSSRILFLLPMASRSETILFKTIANELAGRGHDITYVSPFPVDNAPKNFEVIIPLENQYQFDVGNTIQNRMERNTGKIAELFSFDMTFIFDNCHNVYKSAEFQKIYHKSFDLIFLSAIFNDCFYGLVHKFQVPFILFSSMPVNGPPVTATGLYQPPSFVPLPFFEFSDKMNFLQRLQNSFFAFVFGLMNTYVLQGNYTEIYREYLGHNYPHIASIENNVSLVMSNSHFSTNFPKPLLPDIVEVGGVHCKDAKPLSKELNEFLSGSKEGFIFFSLGSLVKGSSMPESTRKIFVKVFSKLKQRVLWKWETEEMPDLPPNVKLGKWLPQQDILGHPNIKMFITHGGLLSTQEAIYHGVPIIGLPIFVDQDSNMKQSNSLGFAITLEISELTEETLENAIQEILSNSKYANRVKTLSKIFRDQPEPPLKRAVYWTEYILKYKGAEHLRSNARNLNFVQYHSLDVISFLLLCFTFFFITVIITCKLFVRKLLPKGKSSPEVKIGKKIN